MKNTLLLDFASFSSRSWTIFLDSRCNLKWMLVWKCLCSIRLCLSSHVNFVRQIEYDTSVYQIVRCHLPIQMDCLQSKAWPIRCIWSLRLLSFVIRSIASEPVSSERSWCLLAGDASGFCYAITWRKSRLRWNCDLFLFFFFYYYYSLLFLW